MTITISNPLYQHLLFKSRKDMTRKARLPWWLRQESVCLQCGRPGFNPWVRKIAWRRRWKPTPVFLPGKSHGWRSLVGYSSWVAKSQTRLNDFTHSSLRKTSGWDILLLWEIKIGNIFFTRIYVLSLVSVVVVNTCQFCNLVKDYIWQEKILKHKTSQQTKNVHSLLGKLVPFLGGATHMKKEQSCVIIL